MPKLVRCSCSPPRDGAHHRGRVAILTVEWNPPALLCGPEPVLLAAPPSVSRPSFPPSSPGLRCSDFPVNPASTKYYGFAPRRFQDISSTLNSPAFLIAVLLVAEQEQCLSIRILKPSFFLLLVHPSNCHSLSSSVCFTSFDVTSTKTILYAPNAPQETYQFCHTNDSSSVESCLLPSLADHLSPRSHCFIYCWIRLSSFTALLTVNWNDRIPP